jgi:hypothetical protein
MNINYPTYQETDIDIANRLINAFRNTMTQNLGEFENVVGQDLWANILNDPLIQQLIDHLNRGDPVAFSKFLNSFGINTWYGGIHLCNNNSDVYHELEKLCAYYNILINDKDTSNDLIIKLNNYLSVNIVTPLVIPIVGMNTSLGILNYRNTNSVYMANILRNLTSPTDNICEYGGGVGLNAYYLYNMNRKNVYLFDLPFVNVISGYFLIKSLGNDAVVLEGEKYKPNCVHISAFWNCNKYEKDYFEITANQDSFPEIDSSIINKYFNIIEFNTKTHFYSINHEDKTYYNHNIVSDVIANNYPNYEKITRDALSLNMGEPTYTYYEELYKINKI